MNRCMSLAPPLSCRSPAHTCAVLLLVLQHGLPHPSSLLQSPLQHRTLSSPALLKVSSSGGTGTDARDHAGHQRGIFCDGSRVGSCRIGATPLIRRLLCCRLALRGRRLQHAPHLCSHCTGRVTAGAAAAVAVWLLLGLLLAAAEAEEQ